MSAKPSEDDEYEYMEIEEDEEVSEYEEEEEENAIHSEKKASHNTTGKQITSIKDLDKENRNEDKLEEETKARGAVVILELHFPDESVKNIKIPLGQTVEYVKCQIEKQFNIEYSKINVVFEGAPMLDLFCLSDYPSITPLHPNKIYVKA
ncbi:uncharacterized protein MONOS_3015 [Monocercomonoides exilis]|uniref:uncharacterized protein n=1 Tax=Monocercomonoides exilis TaxID=2049356 RepID=UPI00355967BC|nr:hypothetical protein MONOS_3015 [Monocercomonoides exilis]|eukprot:MONOS_3015.1-p1 / transcript=MONOS_3015.1 / gene=MONOS_3015 / organism=Monocercomonoides_exilis_PA203 / gene_product=unspecified product / transcript_product=unspecified product / location=Mono_scaffold00067:20551-21103(+) / protein_length=150 / sequence_SO=supercontig / SO=protein_coding / is_pseudo=false